MKWVFKSPILLYRLGMGFLVGRLFMVMTTIGRKSGQPRHTAIEFHEFKGRKYIFGGWGTRTDWYHNIEADPHVTIQTWRGAENALARRITSETDLVKAFEFAMSNPMIRTVMKSVGFGLALEQFLAHKDRFTFVTFDPTDSTTPAPLKPDLWWIWLLVLALVLIVIVIS
jgi:deazaflavin-dependent oxidoreductase (nitroreductase family)